MTLGKIDSRLFSEVEEIFEKMLTWMSEEDELKFRTLIMLPALKIIKEHVNEARSPVFFVVGRSGHGKSSLINALAGKKVADVHPVRPQSMFSEAYEVVFDELGVTWTIVDSRGIFEVTGRQVAKAIQDLVDDIKKFKPDIIMHVISAPEVRALSEDFKVIGDLRAQVRGFANLGVPFVAVINKCDSLGKRPLHWPPEEYADKEALIQENLDYLALDILASINSHSFLKEGRRRAVLCSDNDDYVAIIPTSCIADEPWNVEVLSEVLYEHLPGEAQLQFLKSQQYKMQRLAASSKVVENFAEIAALTERHPDFFRQLLGQMFPLLDLINPRFSRRNLVPLWPLVIAMVALIGGMAGRTSNQGSTLGQKRLTYGAPRESELSIDIAAGYFAALGIPTRGKSPEDILQSLWELFKESDSPKIGHSAKKLVQDIGRSAQAFYFDDKIVRPGARV